MHFRCSDFPELIETTVFPTTGEDTDKQYVCVTLQIMPTDKYPETKPEFKLKAPRGLDDGGIAAIERAIMLKLDESLGQPVVFDLIDLIREHLTESNLPTGQCVICLYGFLEGDEFTKTACYHYLHSHCLAVWLTNARKNFDEEQAKLPTWQRNEAKPFQSCCPVCREIIIEVDVEGLKQAPPPQELENAPDFHLTDELKALQAEMSKLFLKQKEKGGIIDISTEEKTLIAIDPEGAANEQKRRQEVALNPKPNSSTAPAQKPVKAKPPPTQADDENEDEESSDDDRRRRGGRRQDRYHKGKRERYHGRYRNQESMR